MYGAAWCGDCRRSKALLDGRGVDYEYVDLEMTIVDYQPGTGNRLRP